jgi:hypothetical protein
MPRNHFLSVLLFLTILPHAGNCQTITCTDIRNGVFVFFSRITGSESTYTRNGDTQKEVDPAKHETILWKVEWIDNCSYYLKYESGLEERSNDDRTFLSKHKILTQILRVTNDYYIFRTSFAYCFTT